MIRIAVVDVGAESRNRIVARLSSFLSLESRQSEFVPRISLKPLSIQELKFHAAPDLCVIGAELSGSDPAQLVQIKQILPAAALLVEVSNSAAGLAEIEQLARFGADDVMTPETGPAEFLKKVVLLAKRGSQQGSGKVLLVDSGKGGIGVTTLSAALGEALLQQGRSAALVDCDFETQDLSRFLQVRPFVNENLRLLLDEQRPVSEESVEECLRPVWADEPGLMCLPPPTQADDLYDPHSRAAQAMLNVLEILDSRFDCLVVDMGCARGAIQRMLYRIADKLVFLINSDPATLYAAVDRLRHARSMLSAGAQLLVLENGMPRGGLSNRALRSEFSHAAVLEEADWAPAIVPFLQGAGRWPGSGSSLFSLSSSAAREACFGVLEKLGLVECRPKSRFWLRRITLGGCRRQELENPAARLTARQIGGRQRLPELPAPQKEMRSAGEGGGGKNGAAAGGVNDLEDLQAETLISGVKFG